jgi:hypothetical protein
MNAENEKVQALLSEIDSVRRWLEENRDSRTIAIGIEPESEWTAKIRTRSLNPNASAHERVALTERLAETLRLIPIAMEKALPSELAGRLRLAFLIEFSAKKYQQMTRCIRKIVRKGEGSDVIVIPGTIDPADLFERLALIPKRLAGAPGEEPTAGLVHATSVRVGNSSWRFKTEFRAFDETDALLRATCFGALVAILTGKPGQEKNYAVEELNIDLLSGNGDVGLAKRRLAKPAKKGKEKTKPSPAATTPSFSMRP